MILVTAPAGSRVVVDLGCGTGALARRLSLHYPEVLGIDSAPDRLRLASSTTSGDRRPRYLTGDIARLPLRGGSVDLAFSYGVFHHAPFALACAEARRILRPGGVLIIGDFLEAQARPRRPTLWRHTWSAVRDLPGYARRRGLRRAAVITWFRLTPGWIRHVRSDRFLTGPEFLERYSREFPGAKVVPESVRAFVVWTRPEGES